VKTARLCGGVVLFESSARIRDTSRDRDSLAGQVP
jgi:hypothetical protein